MVRVALLRLSLLFVVSIAMLWVVGCGPHADAALQFPRLEWKAHLKEYNGNPYVDHVVMFDYLFSKAKVSSFLEFGLGKGTKFFLDSCDHVTSVEVLAPSQNTSWFDKCKNDFRTRSNWDPILYQTSTSEAKSLTLESTQFVPEMKKLCDTLFTKKSYDLAFVDAGIMNRGEIVNELFGRAPIIVAHDTNGGGEVYGWNKIRVPNNYARIDFKQGQGAIVWIDKSKASLIQALVGGEVPLNMKTTFSK